VFAAEGNGLLQQNRHDSEVFGAAAIRFPAFHPAAAPSVALRHFRGIEVK
jgi:hypothetical protein